MARGQDNTTRGAMYSLITHTFVSVEAFCHGLNILIKVLVNALLPKLFHLASVPVLLRQLRLDLESVLSKTFNIGLS